MRRFSGRPISSAGHFLGEVHFLGEDHTTDNVAGPRQRWISDVEGKPLRGLGMAVLVLPSFCRTHRLFEQ